MSAFAWLCGINSFAKKRKDDISPENKDRIAKRMTSLATRWQNGEYKNVKDAGWNNFDTFEWLYEKYTHKPLDFSEFPANFKDMRKFELGLDVYNKLIAKPQGYFASKFHLPRSAMQNIPELKRFETELINETSYFRDYTIETTKQVNEILDNFKSFSLSMGAKPITVKGLGTGGQKRIRELLDEYSTLSEQMQVETNYNRLSKLTRKLLVNRREVKYFYENGSGEAFKIINSVLQGADIETIPNLYHQQRTQLNKIKDNYTLIRKAGVTGLVRGLEKIKSMAKDKDLVWVDGTVKRINSLIKAIEFQHVIDTNGKVTEYRYLQDSRDFLSLGFDVKNNADRYVTKNGKVSFSKNYMSQYTLGMIKTIKKVEKAIENRSPNITEEIKKEIDSWDSIVNVAKKRTPIMNPIYDSDPYFFIRKYASDVGVFNYKAHVKSTFKDATDAIVNEHLNVAKESGRKDLQESAESMLRVIRDVYNEIQHKDPTHEGVMTDMMRTMTAVTYFRLMGGNVRSAARNGTQRIYEFTQFGLKASLWDSKKFYNDSGSGVSNQDKLARQQKKFGLQWFDNKSKGANIWDSIKDKSKVSEFSRGALEDAYMMDKELYLTAEGELTIKGSDRVSEKVSRTTGFIAQKGGIMHKIVEDWNRYKTFRVGFALASQNLESTNKSWQAKQILTKKQIEEIKKRKGKDHVVDYNDLVERYGKDTEKTISNWIENKAGQISYNSVLDLHFEYARWAKAKAIKATDENSRALGFIKTGLGQFAHYKFNMANLMNQWVRDGGRSIRAGDFASEEVLRPLRFAILQGSISVATIAGRVNVAKLATNDIVDFADALYTWLGSKREELLEGEMSPKTEEILNKKTHGAKGAYFLGPNVGLGLSIYELLYRASPEESMTEDPRSQFIFEESVEKSVKKDENQELYKKIAIVNSQLARTIAYTWEVIKGGGSVIDAATLELGLFSSKEQRKLWKDWIPWAKSKKRRKKLYPKSMSEADREEAIKSTYNF
tara:strand:- start:4936 stop:7941 length:3006 start_codon:yes stop_codon:yes gene_type:complete